MCGRGDTSRIPSTMSPADCRARMAVSRPEPGPLTKTLICFTPASMALLPAVSAATDAANGVPFFVPLKPQEPEEHQTMVLPRSSVMFTIVLLKEDWMYAFAIPMFFQIFFLRAETLAAGAAAPGTFLTSARVSPHSLNFNYFLAAAAGAAASAFRLADPTVFLLPRRVRAFVFVLWPRTGKLRRWRRPL